MNLHRYPITRDIVIDKLISFHYFELAKNYRHQGERHDFWELVYIDRGELSVSTDTSDYELKQGDMLVYEPNEFHSPRSNGIVPPNIFIVTFECDSEPMSFFHRNKLFHPGEKEKLVLTRLMEEGWNSFGPYPVGGNRILCPREDAPFGSEQLFKAHLETLLIHLIRSGCKENPITPTPVPRNKQEEGTADKIIRYMNEHLDENLTLDELCDQFAVGRTQIGIMIKAKVGCGAIEYMNKLKINRAKTFICEGVYNLTEISELLGYSSLHYFSRHFKKATDMNPSEYAKKLSRLDASRFPIERGQTTLPLLSGEELGSL
ncbi:AraC family transcriptional regulator [Paenibacillus mesophilus]|uniref:AraC family transcriptional regulator n=1 Tax=Paenibacillus mesophilus TaxID=2582849 RepID=UPI00130539EB|nr:AraC family transcriptional regulator [Paenibacillus mesophilus]